MTDPTTEPSGARPFVRAILAAAVLPAVVAAVGAVLVWSWRDELPSRVAIHWGWAGEADGFGSVTTVVALIAGFGALFAAIGLVLVLAARGEPVVTRVAGGVIAGTTTFIAVLAVGLTAGQRGIADAASADAPVTTVLAALAAAGVAAALAVVLVPLWATQSDGPPPDVPRIAVAADERIMWTRSVAAGSLPAAVMVVGVGVTGASGVVTRQWWLLGLTAVLVSFVVVMFSITVTIDRRGVTVQGTFGWPRLRTPIDEISHATVTRVHPIRHFGGYGYRIATFGPLRGASGFVLRGGDALVIERTNRRRTVVVVDDAATAAGLLNTMLEHHRSQ